MCRSPRTNPATQHGLQTCAPGLASVAGELQPGTISVQFSTQSYWISIGFTCLQARFQAVGELRASSEGAALRLGLLDGLFHALEVPLKVLTSDKII